MSPFQVCDAPILASANGWVGFLTRGRTVPEAPFAGAATYQWEVTPGALAYVHGLYQYIGSR